MVRATKRGARTAVDWLDAFLEEVERGNPGLAAGLEAIRAVARGVDPRWAALRGLVSAMSVKAKVVVVLLVLAGLILAPVLLVVLLLVALALAIVVAVRNGAG